VLDTAKAKAHLKACQGLLADSPDFDDFLEKHMT